jgi:hypothetical protein
MVKRFAWFAAGAAAGVSGSAYAQRKVKAAARKLAPSNVANRSIDAAKDRGRAVVDALREGRAHMVVREAELKAVRDGHAVVEGRFADPRFAVPPSNGAVIDLTDARAERSRSRRRRL